MVDAALAKSQTLDELMLAMDVVDTIRHRELLVERELGQGDRDDALRARLREIYTSQGITVTDGVIDQGIKALRDSRFVYTPPVPGPARTLALLWVRRRRIFAFSAALLIGTVVLWGGYQFGITGPARQAAQSTRIELAETLPRALQANYNAVIAEARVEEARTQAAALLRDGHAALSRNDAGAARAAATGLDALLARLTQTYQLRIVSAPGQTTGFWREGDSGAHNNYVIVEAITPGGERLSLPVTSEENGRTSEVSLWGVRVPQSTFDAIGSDKRDDGILENNVIAEKLRGELAVRYRMSVSGGAVTSWDEN